MEGGIWGEIGEVVKEVVPNRLGCASFSLCGAAGPTQALSDKIKLGRNMEWMKFATV